MEREKVRPTMAVPRWIALLLPLHLLPLTSPHDILDDHFSDSHFLDEYTRLLLLWRADDPTRANCDGHMLRRHGNYLCLRDKVSWAGRDDDDDERDRRSNNR